MESYMQHYSEEERRIDDLILRASLDLGLRCNYRLESITPVIHVHNLKEAVSFYEQKLGFMKTSLEERPLNKFMFRDDVELVLRLHRNRTINKSTGYYFIVSTNVEALYAEYRARGVTFLRPLANTKWEGKGFEVKDISGNTLRYSNLEAVCRTRPACQAYPAWFHHIRRSHQPGCRLARAGDAPRGVSLYL